MIARTTPIITTARATSSRVINASTTNTKHQRQRLVVAKYQANRNGVIASASGWKFTQAMNWTGVYTR